MRILRLLFFSTLFLGLIGGAGFFVTREVLLSIAASQLKSGVSIMRQMRLTPGLPSSYCTTSTLPDVPYGTLESLQLVFTSATEYQIEIICDSFLREPEVKDTFSLPPLVKKKPGMAGLLWGDSRSGLTLELWGRQKTLILENQELRVTNQALVAETVVSPVATCEAYGYICCSVETGVGQGAQTNRVRDCPRSCFARCLARPVVLSFTSLPFFDFQSRTAAVAAGEAVTFNYIVEFGAAQAGTVTIDFGDGETKMETDPNSTFDHVYDCHVGTCQYQAKLLVSDTQGGRSLETSIGQIGLTVSAK